MAHRMTTLHEEPLRQNPLQEENEDSYSDPEYDYDNKPSSINQNDYYAKSRMRSSHTIDSFMDIAKKTSTTSTNLLNYRLLTQNQTFHVPTQINKGIYEKPLKNGKLDNIIAGSSPSMNSSTSSGYGSQAVSISNLTNEDTLSLQSMSVDENTPGKFGIFLGTCRSYQYQSRSRLLCSRCDQDNGRTDQFYPCFAKQYLRIKHHAFS